MHFYWGQAVQRLRNSFLGYVFGFFESHPFSKPTNHVGGGNRRSAPEGLEPQVAYPAALYFYVNRHQVAANRVSYRARAVRILQLSGELGVLEVFHHLPRIL